MENDDMTMNDTIYKILIVDDDKDVLDAIQLILKNAGQFKSDITAVLDGKAALNEIEKQEYDLVLSDYKLPGMNGIDLLSNVKKKCPKTARILITGYPSIDVARDAIDKADVHSYMEKPWDNNELRFIVYEALKSGPKRETIRMRKVSKLNLPLEWESYIESVKMPTVFEPEHPLKRKPKKKKSKGVKE